MTSHVSAVNSSRLRTMVVPREHGAWACCWFTRGRQPLNVHKLGFTELGHAVLFGALLCAAFLL